MYSYAITRLPGRNAVNGLTTAQLGAPDYDLLRVQHAAYRAALRRLGLEVNVLDPLPDYPDAYFVEDVAVIIPEVAIVTRPGAGSRRGEQTYIEPVLAAHRPIVRITPPGTLEGGDVLLVGTHFFIGLSERTNAAGASQFGEILADYEYTWSTVQIPGGLHLKSGVNWLGEDRLILTREFAQLEAFRGYQHVVLDPEENYAANTLWINDHLLMPSGFPGAREKLEHLDLPVMELDVSEVHKMDGGLTCLSLRLGPIALPYADSIP